MIDRLRQPCPPGHRIGCVLDVAGCRVDVAIDSAPDPFGRSAAAARLAERLVAQGIGCERRLVRVATLMPSGRPVATVRGRAAAMSVTVSHAGSAVGAACCVRAGVGLDIVDPAEVRHAIDAWFRPDERALMPDDGLLRARLWAAKEAAFKAARLDEGFRPLCIVIDDLDRTGFGWRVHGGFVTVRGQGIFIAAGGHVGAIAVAAPAGSAATPDSEDLA